MAHNLTLPRLLALLTLVLLAACSPPAASTAVPTLDQTYTSEDGTLTFNHPAAWTIREAGGQIFLGTNEQIIADTASLVTATPGQFSAGVIVFSSAGVDWLEADATPREVLGIFAQASPDTSPLAQQVSEITVGSRPAARSEGTLGQDQALLMVLQLEPGAFAVIVGGSAPNELSRFEPTLLAIVETMQYAAPSASTPQPPAPQTQPQATEEAVG